MNERIEQLMAQAEEEIKAEYEDESHLYTIWKECIDV